MTNATVSLTPGLAETEGGAWSIDHNRFATWHVSFVVRGATEEPGGMHPY